MRKCIILLDDLKLSTRVQHRIGNKAYNCAILKQSGLRVPNGFVVIKPASISKNKLEAQLKDVLSHFFETALFAVRSSAREEDSSSYSFGGIYKTQLNVSRENLFEAIQDVQESTFSEQAQAYRNVQGLKEPDKKSMSILVQQMIQSEASGVAFTMNPLTYNKDEIVINASRGLGESLVNGHVKPDEYHIRKASNKIISHANKYYHVTTGNRYTKIDETDKYRQRVHILSESQIQKLCKLLLAVEQQYTTPQDIEWCFDGNHFWIVQSRPITKTKHPDKMLIEWTRANAIEILPELVTPLTLSFLCEHVNQAYKAFYANLLAPEAMLGPIIKPFYGRPYFNLTQFRHVCAATDTPEADVLVMLGHGVEINQTETKVNKRPVSLLKILPALLRINWKQITVTSIMRRQFNTIHQFKKELVEFNPGQASIQELIEFIHKAASYTQRPLQSALLIPGVLILYEKLLRKICNKKNFSYDKLLQAQLLNYPFSVTTAQMYDLLKLSQIARSERTTREFFTQSESTDYANKLAGTHFLSELNQFLSLYGHRGPYESELALASYREDPTALLEIIKQHIGKHNFQTPEEISAQKHQQALQTWRDFTQKLYSLEKVMLSPIVKMLLKRIKQHYLWREQTRSGITLCSNAIRQCYLAIAQYFLKQGWIVQRDDIFYLKADEIQQVIERKKQSHNLAGLINKRRADYQTWHNLKMPLLMHELELPALLHPPKKNQPLASTTQLHGLCVSAGCVEGEVLILRNPKEFKKMKPGTIIVAPATDPSWIPLFTLATGVIVEIGGILSHASLVAREFGLPALANVQNATTLLHDGQKVYLDATHGVVKMLESKGSGIKGVRVN